MKHCAICGDEFQESRQNQKYCPECGKDPERARRRYAQAERTVRRHMEGDYPYYPKECTCKECGKKYISGENMGFCSTACFEKWRSEHAKCPICGRLLRDGGNMSGRGYCSPECKEKAEIERAKKNENYIACEQCGKMFIRHGYGNRFCSVKCAREWQSAHKTIVAPKPYAPFKKKCPVCGAEFECGKENRTQKYCSRDCQQKAYREAHRKPKRQKSASNGELNICATCKTAYKDCRRMQSGFTYLPTGAKAKIVNGRTVIVECPMFTE